MPRTLFLLQDPWILCVWFCDDRHLSGPTLGDHLPPRTPGQHQEDQVHNSGEHFDFDFILILMNILIQLVELWSG